MIALALALLGQTPSAAEAPAPPLTAADPCVELRGHGVALIEGQRFKGRALARTLTERIPAGRPVFVRFANDRAGNDVEAMTAVTLAAQVVHAPQIVIVETCEVAAGGISQ